MARYSCLAIASALFIVASASDGYAQTAASTAAATAVNASPGLVGELSNQMNATPEQSAGAAGALFGVAKSRLKPDQFSQVAKAVPGMDSLLKAAPTGGGGDPLGAVSQLGGAAGGLAGAASAFSKLGLSPDMVSKAVPVLIGFVTKSGGANVGNLLAGALK